MKNFYIILVVVVLIVGGIFLFNKSSQAPSVNNQTPPPSNESQNKTGNDDSQEISFTIPFDNPVSAEWIVTYTDAGYMPLSIKIKVGETVTFKNESVKEMWPATAMHPTHTVYPGSDIKKCGTPEEMGMFDACRGIAPGSTWSFKFEAAGTWKYHDHLDAKKFGTIVVE